MGILQGNIILFSALNQTHPAYTVTDVMYKVILKKVHVSVHGMLHFHFNCYQLSVSLSFYFYFLTATSNLQLQL